MRDTYSSLRYLYNEEQWKRKELAMKRFAVLFVLVALLGSCAGTGNMPGLSPLAVEFSGTNGQVVDFGVMPGVYSERAPGTITITAWVKETNHVTDQPAVVVSFSTNNGGVRFYFLNDWLLVYSNNFASSPGNWMTGSSVITHDTWYHVAMTFDISSTANNPLAYVNGSSSALTELITPAGTALSRDGIPLLIGNDKTSTENYNHPWNGELFDVRVYNRILTADEITAIYNTGTPSMSAGTKSGLVFQSFAVRTEKLADYTDANLSGLKLFDAQFLAVGEVIGSVTGRAAP